VYYQREVKGKNYPLYCRKCRAPGAVVAETDAKEEILLDCNELAAGMRECQLSIITSQCTYE
jgi:protease II